ncbi:uncharacterized protein [Diadema setosum]|uniref:uncharacterized protein n=1 Tax=Diadema setosum TaxID=31175 RepID=UPI003B3BBE42
MFQRQHLCRGIGKSAVQETKKRRVLGRDITILCQAPVQLAISTDPRLHDLYGRGFLRQHVHIFLQRWLHVTSRQLDFDVPTHGFVVKLRYRRLLRGHKSTDILAALSQKSRNKVCIVCSTGRKMDGP